MSRDLERLGPARRRRRWALIGLAAFLLLAAAALWAVLHPPPVGVKPVDNQPEPSGAAWLEKLTEAEQSRLGELGGRYWDLRRAGRWAEAVAPMRSILELLSRTPGVDHPETATLRERLRFVDAVAALPHNAQEEMRQSEQLVDTVTSLVGQGRIDEALREENHIYEIRRHRLGENFMDVALGLIHVGYLQGELHHYPEAEATTRKALRIIESLVGRDHPEMAKAYHNLGGYLFNQEKYEEAEDSLRKALEIRRRRVGKHLFTALTHLALAKCLKVRADRTPGKLTPDWIREAQSHLQEAQDIALAHKQRAAELKRRLSTATGNRAVELRSAIERNESESGVILQRISGIGDPGRRGANPEFGSSKEPRPGD
jgi:tetratricopeptide (TPR) repeat protein